MITMSFPLFSLESLITQGPRSTFSSGGAKEECAKENFFEGPGGGHTCGFLFNFSKVTENANNVACVAGAWK